MGKQHFLRCMYIYACSGNYFLKSEHVQTAFSYGRERKYIQLKMQSFCAQGFGNIVQIGNGGNEMQAEHA